MEDKEMSARGVLIILAILFAGFGLLPIAAILLVLALIQRD
ncbi:hypothetical protein SmphiM6_115 [Sinorhizobium phage phiM6]|nr:hypothetical protein SmphiM6_115 [Sinorhizobium phage phiM6]